MSPPACIVCDLGQDVGLGHFVRAKALADYIQSQYGITFHIIIEPDSPLPAHLHNPRIIIWDLEKGCPDLSQIKRLKAEINVGFIGAGYKAEGYEVLDLAIVQGPAEVPDKCILVGPEYVVLRKEFAAEPIKRNNVAGRVFVCGGGADPLDITGLACRVLESMAEVRHIEVVLGQFYRGAVHEDNLSTSRFTIHRNVDNPFQIMRSCDLAVLSYGVIALECLACGLPTIALAMSQDHKNSADALFVREALVSLGQPGPGLPYILNRWIRAILQETSLRDIYSANGRALIDGRGAERVAAKIMELIN